ncbi:MAG: hypothetical protein IIW04_01825, partial [Aeriscardovia sp.]|nr:hypothetical protein [Aeriscardovia sp.]
MALLFALLAASITLAAARSRAATAGAVITLGSRAATAGAVRASLVRFPAFAGISSTSAAALPVLCALAAARSRAATAGAVITLGSRAATAGAVRASLVRFPAFAG